MPAARPLAALTLLLLGARCSPSTSPDGAAAAPAPAAVPAGDCEGPAVSVPPGALAEVPRRGGAVPSLSDSFADLARQAPGGFAGVFYDAGRPVLLLTDPTQAAAARAALAPRLADFPVAAAEVRGARWDAAQLKDWYDYLLYRTPLWRGGDLSGGGTDTGRNRLRYDAVDAAARDRIVATFRAPDLPCDLAEVYVTPIRLSGR